MRQTWWDVVVAVAWLCFASVVVCRMAARSPRGRCDRRSERAGGNVRGISSSSMRGSSDVSVSVDFVVLIFFSKGSSLRACAIVCSICFKGNGQM